MNRLFIAIKTNLYQICATVLYLFIIIGFSFFSTQDNCIFYYKNLITQKFRKLIKKNWIIRYSIWKANSRKKSWDVNPQTKQMSLTLYLEGASSFMQVSWVKNERIHEYLN